MNNYNNYEVTYQQRRDLAILRKEYSNLPYCKNYTEAETIINKYKYRLKGLPVPLTKNQKKLLAKLRNEYKVYVPFCNDQKKAIEIIQQYTDEYELLHNERLKGFEEEFSGGRNNPITPKQTMILESLIICYGEDIVPKMSTSKEAWYFINKYQYMIYKNELGFFIDDVNVNILKKEIKEAEEKLDCEEIVQQNPVTKLQKKLIAGIKKFYGDDLYVPEFKNDVEARKFIQDHMDEIYMINDRLFIGTDKRKRVQILYGTLDLWERDKQDNLFKPKYEELYKELGVTGPTSLSYIGCINLKLSKSK